MIAAPAILHHLDADTARFWWVAVKGLIVREAQAEWFGSPFHRLTLRGPRPEGAAARPRDARPVSGERGKAIATGNWSFAGQTMTARDPWDRPSPSRAFAERLHGFDWLPDLLSLGEAGEREALRLLLDWRRVFGKWNGFSWSVGVLERRVFNLACGLKPILARASEAEAVLLADSLARQARHLLLIRQGVWRRAERLAAAALAGAALAGPAGETIMAKALPRLGAALAKAVLPDGVHASRSPQAGLELLLDLVALDDGLSQRGRPAPEEMSRAIDRLAAALRLLTLPDGRLAAFQGGEAADALKVAAARAACDLGPQPTPPPMSAPHGGYQRLAGPSLTVIADAAPPARGAWSQSACGQPLAIEVLSGSDRLIVNCGWSPSAVGPQAMRLSTAGSTLSLGESPVGEPVGPFMARALGPRLEHAPRKVEARRHEAPEGAWLELAHDGWIESWSLRHERLIFLDRKADELRGEDRLIPAPGGHGKPGRVATTSVRLHLDPSVRASLARDLRSVLLQGPTAPGRWLRNDAEEVAIEHSVHFEDGLPRRSTQVVLRSRFPAATGGRIRWKLAAAEGA